MRRLTPCLTLNPSLKCVGSMGCVLLFSSNLQNYPANVFEFRLDKIS